MNKEVINTAVEKIREILDEHPGGEPNETARRLVHRHADAIIKSGLDQNEGYIVEKAGDIKSEIDSYYSARKWHKYKRDYTDGVQELHGRIYSLLGRIESWHGWEDIPKLPDKTA
jgi:hypothetical protein